MNEFECYKMYLALKRHFSSDYDYIKYNGSVTAKTSTYEKRADKYHFKKISQQGDKTFNILLSNIVKNPDVYIRSINSTEGKECYKRFMKIQESLFRTFQLDLKQLDENFNSNIIVVNGNIPPLIKLYQQSKIHIETVIILDQLCTLFEYWNKNIKEDFVWPEIYSKLKNYSSFIKPDLYKYRVEVIKAFTQ